MAYTGINKHTAHFNTKTYTGNASGQTITGVGFQPDFIWVKGFDAGYDHSLHNSVSGVLKKLASNKNDAEVTNTDTITSTNSDGFVLGADTAGPAANSVNQDTKNYVAWNWKGGGSSSTNNDGSITSYVSANTTAGFSVVTWNGNSGTVGHGLGVKPDFIVVKSRQTAGSNNWVMTGSGLGANMNDTYLILNADSVQGSGSNTWGGEPTAQHFTVSSGVAANDNNVAYCFATKTGYSSSGQYKGANNANGSFIYTGFKPSFVMIKSTSPAADWTINDNVRDAIPHPNNYRLFLNTNAAQSTGSDSMDFLSNGFKLRSTDSGNNGNGGWYWYIAFGQSLVGTNNVPCTAR